MTEDIQTKYNAIKGADFDTSKKDISLAISVEGLEGTGKTHFALLTCPLPIVHINFSDRDANIFLYDMDEERRKQVTLYSDPFQAKTSQGWTRAEGQAALAALSEIAQDHLANGKMKGGTFVLDSGSSFWEVVQEVYVAPQQEKRQSEGGKRSGGLEYMQGNLIVNGVISWLKQQGAHVILTHRKRQDWDAKGPIPGQFSAQLNKKVPYLVEVRLDLYKTCEVCGSEFCEKKGHQGRKHWGRIVKFGRNTQMEGMCFENPSFDLVYNLYAAGNGGGN